MFLRVLLCLVLVASQSIAASPPPMAGAGVLVRDGKSDCSAALIAPDLLATAAHCTQGKKLTARGGNSTILFRTGAYPGHPAVEREAIDLVTHPLFGIGKSITGNRLGADLALIRLSEPIPATVAQPFEIIGEVEVGERILIASWPGGVGERARERRCPVLTVENTIMSLSCVVRPGESGGPVVRITDTGPELLGIVVAAGREGHQPYGFAVLTSARLGQLRAILGF